MSAPPPPLPQAHIELLGNCIGLLSDTPLVPVVATLLVTGRVPEDDEERNARWKIALKWTTTHRIPLRKCRPGHPFDVERDVADYIRQLYFYAHIDWTRSVRSIASVEASYARYLERTSYLSQNP